MKQLTFDDVSEDWAVSLLAEKLRGTCPTCGRRIVVRVGDEFAQRGKRVFAFRVLTRTCACPHCEVLTEEIAMVAIGWETTIERIEAAVAKLNREP